MSVPNDCTILGKEVEIGEIDVELKRLWEADEARTNASLMNFAVYSEDSSALSKNSEMVREITREHACRAILVAVDRDDPEVGMRAWVTAHCNLANGNKTVCCEQLAFHLAGRVSGRFRNTIFANLQSDLPLIFWWQGELTERFDDRIYSLIQRLVVDSADWANPLEQFQRLKEPMLNENLVVQDLSWTRTYHIRLGIAAMFDDPHAQDVITGIQKVNIVTSPDCETSGIQLLSWIVTQCGWLPAQELIETEAARGSYHFENTHGGVIEAKVTAEEDSSPISLVEIIAGDVRLSVTRPKGDHLIHLRVEADGYVSEQSTPADSMDSVGLMRDQLSRGGKNSLFRKVLPTFMELLSQK
ncbi:glucose-6-phosphate dehydrogenase assembly protein OpcA [Rubritalea spongiae]|uniref:Glucose-6-phosphate dehydrogenase assembly protein OpcA n=1 Tax=Rubritalea spongiae TaxID=430797 RepID=A0ABW5E440_9BACT